MVVCLFCVFFSSGVSSFSLTVQRDLSQLYAYKYGHVKSVQVLKARNVITLLRIA